MNNINVHNYCYHCGCLCSFSGIKEKLPYKYFKVFPPHTVEILERLNGQRGSGRFCDITFQVDNVDFRAHRCILAASSETFKLLIDEDPLSDYICVMANIKSAAFIVILDYIYTGTVTLKLDCVESVLFAARYFSLQDIENSCQQYMDRIQFFKSKCKKKSGSKSSKSRLGFHQTALQTNTYDLRQPKGFCVLSNSGSGFGNIRTNADYLRNEMENLGETNLEIHSGSPQVSHSKQTETSKISVQTLDENSCEDPLLQSVLTQVNQSETDLMNEQFNDSVCSDIFIKRESISPPLVNIQEEVSELTIESLIRKNSVRRAEGKVHKRIKTSSRSVDMNSVMVGVEANINDLSTMIPIDELSVISNIENPSLNSAVCVSKSKTNKSRELFTSSLGGDSVLKRRDRLEKRNMITHAKYSRTVHDHFARPLSCSVCNQGFLRQSDLTRHRRAHENIMYKCRHCSAEFKSGLLLKQHSISLHGDSQCFTCPHYGCKFSSNRKKNVEAHRFIHEPTRQFQCVACGKSFAQFSGLSSHLKCCNQERSYLCDFCGLKFNYLQEMTTHRRIHTGEKPYQCNDCSAQFSDRQNYKRHRRIHENSFPFCCQLCQKQFRHSNSLKAHMENH